MTDNEKRFAVIGGIVATAIVVWLLLQHSAGSSSTTTGPTLGGLTLGGNTGGDNSSVFNVGGPGAVTFAISGPTPAGSSDGTVAPCNCPDVATVYYGDTTDQATSSSMNDMLTNLGKVLNDILPAGVAAQGYYPGNTLLQKRVSAYKMQQAEYMTPPGDINAAFAAMNLG